MPESRPSCNKATEQARPHCQWQPEATCHGPTQVGVHRCSRRATCARPIGRTHDRPSSTMSNRRKRKRRTCNKRKLGRIIWIIDDFDGLQHGRMDTADGRQCASSSDVGRRPGHRSDSHCAARIRTTLGMHPWLCIPTERWYGSAHTTCDGHDSGYRLSWPVAQSAQPLGLLKTTS